MSEGVSMALVVLPFPPRIEATADNLMRAYRRLKSVHRVGAEFGIHGNTVHNRLRKAGYDISRAAEFTPEQLNAIRHYYETTPHDSFNQASFAATLGKTKHNVARAAKRMGIFRIDRPERVAKRERIAAGKRRWIANGGHSKGMLGKKHSPETKALLSVASKRSWSTAKTFGGPLVSEEMKRAKSLRMSKMRASQPAENCYSRTRSGRRADIGDMFFRSSWEANYARYLNLLVSMKVVEEWHYEPETFWFDGVKRGTNSYKPDFRVKYRNDEILEYVEVKGWETPKDRTKWKRMKKYHPRIKLVVIGPKEYKATQIKWAAAIPNWESSKGGGKPMGPRKSKRAA